MRIAIALLAVLALSACKEDTVQLTDEQHLARACESILRDMVFDPDSLEIVLVHDYTRRPATLVEFLGDTHPAVAEFNAGVDRGDEGEGWQSLRQTQRDIYADDDYDILQLWVRFRHHDMRIRQHDLPCSYILKHGESFGASGPIRAFVRVNGANITKYGMLDLTLPQYR